MQHNLEFQNGQVHTYSIKMHGKNNQNEDLNHAIQANLEFDTTTWSIIEGFMILLS